MRLVWILQAAPRKVAVKGQLGHAHDESLFQLDSDDELSENLRTADSVDLDKTFRDVQLEHDAETDLAR